MTVAVYARPDPPSLDAAPPDTAISPGSKPLTASLNVNVTANGPFTVSAAALPMVSSGATRSASIENCSAATLAAVAPMAAPAGRSIVKAPAKPASGVMVARQTVPSVICTRSDAAPLPTAISASSSPLTGLLNVNAASNGPATGAAAPLVMNACGAL